jgi:uncharacterized protein (DUF302 family)
MEAMTPDGLIACVSKFGPKETMDRLASAVTTRGISILARIDHAAAAAAIGMELRPTEVLVFGNPRAGTPLMQAVQTVGIDLPLKALVWEDESGTTRLAYNDPRWLAQRHGVDAGLDRALTAMADALAVVAREAMAASAEER